MLASISTVTVENNADMARSWMGANLPVQPDFV